MNQAILHTDEELMLVTTYMLYPLILDLLERDLKVMNILQLRMLPVPVGTFRQAQELIMKDIAALRKSIRLQGVKLYEERRAEKGLEITFVCRGDHRHVHLPWNQVRGEVVRKLGHYFGAAALESSVGE